MSLPEFRDTYLNEIGLSTNILAHSHYHLKQRAVKSASEVQELIQETITQAARSREEIHGPFLFMYDVTRTQDGEALREAYTNFEQNLIETYQLLLDRKETLSDQQLDQIKFEINFIGARNLQGLAEKELEKRKTVLDSLTKITKCADGIREIQGRFDNQSIDLSLNDFNTLSEITDKLYAASGKLSDVEYDIYAHNSELAFYRQTQVNLISTYNDRLAKERIAFYTDDELQGIYADITKIGNKIKQNGGFSAKSRDELSRARGRLQRELDLRQNSKKSLREILDSDTFLPYKIRAVQRKAREAKDNGTIVVEQLYNAFDELKEQIDKSNTKNEDHTKQLEVLEMYLKKNFRKEEEKTRDTAFTTTDLNFPVIKISNVKNEFSTKYKKRDTQDKPIVGKKTEEKNAEENNELSFGEIHNETTPSSDKYLPKDPEIKSIPQESSWKKNRKITAFLSAAAVALGAYIITENPQPPSLQKKGSMENYTPSLESPTTTSSSSQKTNPHFNFSPEFKIPTAFTATVERLGTLDDVLEKAGKSLYKQVASGMVSKNENNIETAKNGITATSKTKVAAADKSQSHHSITGEKIVQKENGQRYIAHVLKPGDNPWELAEKYLGTGRRFKEIQNHHGQKQSFIVTKKEKNIFIPLEESPEFKEYIVQPNDGWQRVTKNLFGGHTNKQLMEDVKAYATIITPKGKIAQRTMLFPGDRVKVTSALEQRVAIRRVK